LRWREKSGDCSHELFDLRPCESGIQLSELLVTSHELVTLDGSTFFVSAPSGDVDGLEMHGFFHADVRHLSIWKLFLEGTPIRVLTSRSLRYYAASIFGTLASARIGENPPVSVQRERIVAGGVHEDIVVENNSQVERRVALELRYGSDFADIFDIKDRTPKKGVVGADVGPGEVTLWYRRDDFRRGTRISFSEPCELTEDRARFDLVLPPRQMWQTHIDISCLVGDEERRPRHDCQSPGELQPQMPLTLEEWLEEAPQLDTDFDPLLHTYRRSLLDLAALRFRPLERVPWSLPAAGLPWFMALFGRDSLITAYEALPFQPQLAATTLETLSAFQATEDKAFRDAEPGKILHELRMGERASLGEIPHTPYYGSHDSTPLFLILLDEYERWTGDTELVRRLEPTARAALAWIQGPGDPDGDGYLEYRTRSSRGLSNQCWKDSWNSILFADGTVAQPPIATCELQGYAYDARWRTARLAREVWGDAPLAVRLEQEAVVLRERFDGDFWNEERGHYVLALDGEKRQVDALTSNVGHLLWSGIVPEHRAALTVQRLMAPDMFSGWGIRTMSAADAGYSPIEYHNGTVWPHDTAMLAEGMRRHGFREEAATLTTALIEAANAFDDRLPEVFAGFPRERTRMPVEYPTASRPQAWSAAAPLLALRTVLGLDVEGGRLRSSPVLPPTFGQVKLRRIPVCGGRVDASS
jgi:glycogen debranching enzyme